jgi:polynucleotide 5'-kinase involved in rRNA processing
MVLEHEQSYDRLVAAPGVVFLLGGIDTGKTTFGIELVRRATAAGVPSALVDADIGQSTVGPPTTVGLKLCTGMTDVSKHTVRVADGLAFVGSITPRGHLLSLVTGTAKLTSRAREAGCRLIVVDTTGFLSGVHAQTLKYFKLDLIAPDFIVAFERGGELEPIVGIAQRFTPADVIELGVLPEVAARSADERAAFREQQFAAYFSGGSSRWRVKPTVFMPTLPPEFDLALLDGLVVGMEDGKGSCVGIGVLEFDPVEDILRMVSPISEGVRGLRLGSIRIDTDGRSRGPVDLRELFRTE